MSNSEIKICQNCKASFEIDASDFAFYAKISASGGSAAGGKVPPPTWCPECRSIRRLAFRNERKLYKRKCDLCNAEIISMYSAESPYKVYCHQCWWSDNWDPMQYGKDVDFLKPFLEQFKELQSAVPRLALINTNSVNSEYTNYAGNNKNCYLIFSNATGQNENCGYGTGVRNCRDSYDMIHAYDSELINEVVDCQRCYHSSNINYCFDCSDCHFCEDLKNCSNCIGCKGLRGQQYCIFNQKYTKEQYFEKIKEFNLNTFHGCQKVKEKFEEIRKRAPNKYAHITKAENCSGDYITNSKNAKVCFDTNDTENSKFLKYSVKQDKECFDSCYVTESELGYENLSLVNSYKCHFNNVVWWNVRNLEYCELSFNSENLFGCISLKKKQYCILNKQYSKDEYEKLVPKIIEHMNKMPYISRKSEILNPKSETNSKSQIQNSQTREIVYRYGEFFPPELSPFAYNETIAQEYFPLSAEAAAKAGFNWKQPETRNIKIDLKTEDLPDHIKDVPDSIVGKVIQCTHAKFNMGTSDVPGINNNLRTSDVQKLTVTCNEQCTEAFKIIEPELQFYRKMNLPLPRLCPNCRHYARLRQRNPLKLWKRKCMCAGEKSEIRNSKSETLVYQNTIKHFHGNNPCPNEFETTYSPDRLEIVYCEKCYQAEVV